MMFLDKDLIIKAQIKMLTLIYISHLQIILNIIIRFSSMFLIS